jgi:creatinine amidohydrolase
MLHEYHLCRPDELEAAIREFPCAYLALGALEWHAPHLPLGFDGLKAESLVKTTADQIGKGILFPTLYFGAYDTMRFPYTFHFPRRALQCQLEQYVKDLIKMGFRMIIILTGHYPASHVSFLEKLAKKYMRKYSNLYVFAGPEYLLLPAEEMIGDHAAAIETSLGMALFAEHVDQNKLPQDFAQLSYIERCKRFGIMGKNPIPHASIEAGKQMADAIITELVKRINQVWVEKLQTGFLEIYSAAAAQMKRLKNPKNLDATWKILGMDSKKDFIAHGKWLLFSGGKQQLK